ncbi:glycoside hydrolase family 28 protein [Plicaturopsis crispa FD-325 SS-3]|nr:glycoside hydrolase family 28 protein [Plicaturopsis crispa FD-325 SS-3]
MTVISRYLRVLLVATSLWSLAAHAQGKTCRIRPLGAGKDDTTQVEAAIAKCGKHGHTILEAGDYNITRKMTWNLANSKVDLYGYLSFQPDIQYWLNANNTYRVVFIQNQASWFVVSGHDFTIDAHNAGGIKGNGQPWWDYYTNVTREDGDGRPLSLTLYNVTRGRVHNFEIDSPPFWCNTVANSYDVVYDGMKCNATNTNPAFAGQNIVPNTDGIDTYRSDKVALLNWDVTCGDDCLAVKGNTTNLLVSNYTCWGGNGVAFGSLGQYAELNDIVENVVLEDLRIQRIDPKVQPNMGAGVYFKTWTDTVNGSPPTGGGGGGGFVKNVTVRNVQLGNVSRTLHVYQTNGGHSGDAPSTLQFSDLTFDNWKGTTGGNTLVDIECSPAVPCPNIFFKDFNVQTNGSAPRYICQNVVNEQGLDAPCNATGQA